MAVKVINYDDRLYELGELEDFEAGLLKRTIEIADQAKQKGKPPIWRTAGRWGRQNLIGTGK